MVDQPYEAHGTSRGSIPNGFPAAMFAEVECFICHVSIQHLSAALSAWTDMGGSLPNSNSFRRISCKDMFLRFCFASDQCLPEF